MSTVSVEQDHVFATVCETVLALDLYRAPRSMRRSSFTSMAAAGAAATRRTEAWHGFGRWPPTV